MKPPRVYKEIKIIANEIDRLIKELLNITNKFFTENEKFKTELDEFISSLDFEKLLNGEVELAPLMSLVHKIEYKDSIKSLTADIRDKITKSYEYSNYKLGILEYLDQVARIMSEYTDDRKSFVMITNLIAFISVSIESEEDPEEGISYFSKKEDIDIFFDIFYKDTLEILEHPEVKSYYDKKFIQVDLDIKNKRMPKETDKYELFGLLDIEAYYDYIGNLSNQLYSLKDTLAVDCSLLELNYFLLNILVEVLEYPRNIKLVMSEALSLTLAKKEE